ncbi:telomere binding protein [Savitreella phatthalungensis]
MPDGMQAAFEAQVCVERLLSVDLQDGDPTDELLSAACTLAGLNNLLDRPPTSRTLTLLSRILRHSEFGPERFYCRFIDCKSPDAVDSEQLWRQYVAAIVGGRIHNHIARTTVNEALNKNEKTIWTWLLNAEEVIAFYITKIITFQTHCPSATSYVTILLDRLISLHDVATFCAAVRAADSLSGDALETIFSILPQVRHRVVAQGIQQIYRNTVVDTMLMHAFCRDPNRLQAMTTVWLRSSANKIGQFDQPFADLANRHGASQDAIRCGLQLWSNAMYIQFAPSSQQDLLTRRVLLLVHRLGDASVSDRLLKSTLLSEGVTRRLNSLNPEIRRLATVLPDFLAHVACANGGSVAAVFGLESAASMMAAADEGFKNPLLVAHQPPQPVLESTSPRMNVYDTKSRASSKRLDLRCAMPLPDSDNEDDGNDASEIDRQRASRPTYLRDCIAMLLKHDSPDDLLLALRTIPDLLKRKRSQSVHILELEDWISRLVEVLVNMRNSLDQDGFERERHDALTTSLLVAPKLVGPILAREVFKSDLALSQRLVILSVCRAVCRSTPVSNGRAQLDLDGTLAAPPQLARFSKVMPGKASGINQADNRLRPDLVENHILLPMLQHVLVSDAVLADRATADPSFVSNMLLSQVLVTLVILLNNSQPGIARITVDQLWYFLTAITFSSLCATEPELQRSTLLLVRELLAMLSRGQHLSHTDETRYAVQKMHEWCLMLQVSTNAGRDSLLSDCLILFSTLGECGSLLTTKLRLS